MELTKRKSPKRKQVLVAINSLTSINVAPYMDHSRLMYHLGRHHRNIDFHQMIGRRMAIDRFRNMAAKQALMVEYDYIFFMDDDMQIPADTFGKLYAPHMDILSAHTYIRGYPFDIMSFKYEPTLIRGRRRLTNLVQDDLERANRSGIVACDAIGTAVCLINVNTTIRKMPSPWFLTSPQQTEDIYFCLKAKECNKRIRIGMHKDIVCGHQLDPEVISYHTRDAHMRYVESFMTPEQLARLKETKDHGEQYIKDNILPGFQIPVVDIV